MKEFSRLIVLITLALFTLLSGCATSNPDLGKQLRAQSGGAPERGPVMLAAYQPWFGRPGHIDVGYSSQDRVVLEKQVVEAKNLGIAGFVVNWYGPAKDFEDRSYAMLQSVSAAQNFKVSLMYDEHVETPERATDQAISDLQYAYERYIGPTASIPRESYLRHQGRPVIFIFPKNAKTDWKRVKQTVASWEQAPLLIYKDTRTDHVDQFDGFYAWVQPGDEGWSKDGSNDGSKYLDAFYKEMSGKYKQKVAVGAAWPGFDDSRASWSRNRKMNGRCGKTFDDSLRLFRRYFKEDNPLPYLMIVTWNDYEEGTAIEKGIDRCNGNKDAVAKK